MASAKPSATKAPRRLIGLVILLLVVLIVALCLRAFYWLPLDDATQKAKDYVKQQHPSIAYESARSWRKLNGHWGMEFSSTPPVMVDVDRQGVCKEE